MSLAHAQRDYYARSEGQRGDGERRRREPKGIRDHTGEQRTDGVAHVAPQPIDAHARGAPARMRDVADGGKQRRV